MYFGVCIPIFCLGGRTLGYWCREHRSASCLSTPNNICGSEHRSRWNLHPSPSSFCTSLHSTCSSCLIFLIHHHHSSVLALTSSLLFSVPYLCVSVCLSIHTVSFWGFVCVHVLVCVVAGIDRLMPKRKFPEFCEGLPKHARIKCVCVWVKQYSGGGGWLHFGKRETQKGGHGQSVWFSLIPGPCSEPQLKYYTAPAFSLWSKMKGLT